VLQPRAKSRLGDFAGCMKALLVLLQRSAYAAYLQGTALNYPQLTQSASSAGLLRRLRPLWVMTAFILRHIVRLSRGSMGEVGCTRPLVHSVFPQSAKS
jgi:hypothetical protein